MGLGPAARKHAAFAPTRSRTPALPPRQPARPGGAAEGKAEGVRAALLPLPGEGAERSLCPSAGGGKGRAAAGGGGARSGPPLGGTPQAVGSPARTCMWCGGAAPESRRGRAGGMEEYVYAPRGAGRLSRPCVRPLRLHSRSSTGDWRGAHPRRMAALLTHRKTRVTHGFWGFLHLQAGVPSPSRRGNLMVLVLSLLHSTDLHCKRSLGIALLSQLILSSDIQKQNSVLILLMSLLMPHARHRSGNPFYRNLLRSLH